MTIKLSSIKNDIETERNGDFIEIPEWPGVELGVRSIELPAYKISVDLLSQKYARKYTKGKTVPPDVLRNDIAVLLNEHILFGWKGFDEEYSPDFALEMMTSEEGRDFVKNVAWAATQVGNIDIEFIESAAKN